MEHARWFASQRDVELVGVLDNDREIAEACSRKLGVPILSDIDALIATKPRLVSVRSTSADRTRYIRALIEANVNVVASLPIVSDLDELAGLAALARSNGVILAGDFHLRFTPAVHKAKAWLAEGAVGTPLFINVNLFTRTDDKDDPAGCFRSLGIHGMDLVRTFAGDVTRVQCFATKPANRQNWSTAQITLHFADNNTPGPVGTLTLSADMSLRHPIGRVEMAGSRARFTIENVYEEATLFVHDDEEKRVVTNSIFGGVPQLRTTYGLRLAAIVKQIQTGDASGTDLDEVLKSAAVVEAAIDAANTGKVIETAPYMERFGVVVNAAREAGR